MIFSLMSPLSTPPLTSPHKRIPTSRQGAGGLSSEDHTAMLPMEGGASIPIKYKKLPRTDTLLMQGTEMASVGFWPSALTLYSKGQPMTAPQGALGCAFITGFHGKRCHGGVWVHVRGKKS